MTFCWRLCFLLAPQFIYVLLRFEYVYICYNHIFLTYILLIKLNRIHMYIPVEKLVEANLEDNQ